MRLLGVAKFVLLASFLMALNVSNALSFYKSSIKHSTSTLSVSREARCVSMSASFVGCVSALRPEARNDFASTCASSIPHTTTSYWIMGKGDGKRKKPKKKAASAVALPVAELKPQPQRVSTDVNIPVRHQIRWGQMKKAIARSSNAGFRQPKIVRTKYRRSWDEEEIEIKKEERARKGKDPDWSVILNQTASRPLVVVDGYNIIHQWPRLKKHMTKGDTSRARQLLVDDLESLRALKGWRIECVFDGASKSNVGPLGHGPGGSQGTKADRSLSMDVSKHGVRVVFTGQGVEADSYIERRCYEAKNVTNGELTRSFIVATDDAMIRFAGQNAGAMCMSATRFVDELKAIKKATEYRVEVAMAKVNGHSVRPEKLRGTHIHVSTFGRNSVLIEDKRNRTKRTRLKDIELLPEDMVNVTVNDDKNGIPWWAQVPNRTKL
ncbi:YacP-like NYN domain [Fragilaria crotonensis]|nr:YacP-like NYN domain [Fragilaria crotonensis]